jgi:hypothetical protein
MRLILGTLGILLMGAAAMVAPITVRAGATTPSPAPEHPPLGINLEGVSDYARSMMFVDAIKSARKFGSPDSPWDEKAPLDADGWPTTDAGTVVIADTPIPAGDYLFSCTGRCQLTTPASSATVHALAYDRATNTTTAIVTLPPHAENLFLGFKNTTGGVKNIRLLRPGYPRSTDQVFTKEFLSALEPFSTLRMMDFVRTNSTHVATWAERPHLTDALQSSSNGVAWEYAIQLANTTGKDLWINIPAQADDDYVRHLAQLLKDSLNPNCHIYIEYSNEVWNSIFPQFHQNLEAAKAEVAGGMHVLDEGEGGRKDDNIYYWAWKRVSQRLVQIAGIFREVWGKDADRLRPVLASQSAQPFMVRKQVQFIASTYGPPSQFIYGIAGAPYLGPDDQFNKRDDVTLDDIFNQALPHGTIWVNACMRQYDAIARSYGLHSLCYEGGIALEGEHSLPVKILANHDPRIARTITTYLNSWYSQGGELFMYFNLASGYGKYGCWGLTDDLHKIGPKYKAAAAVAAEPMPALTAGVAVPAIIPAWRFDANDGGRIEDSGDGGKDVGFFSNGNTLDYFLTAHTAGDYTLTLQTASAQDGAAIELFLNGRSLGTLPCANTGGWHLWKNSPPLALHLHAGVSLLRLKIVRQPINIRSITLELHH